MCTAQTSTEYHLESQPQIRPEGSAFIGLFTVYSGLYHLQIKTTACVYEKIFRSTSAADPFSIFVFARRGASKVPTWFCNVE